MSTLATQLGTFPSATTRRVGFDVEAFHGRGDGTLVEMDDILAQAQRFGFAAQRIWLSPRLYRSAEEGILSAPGNSYIFMTTLEDVNRTSTGELKNGPILVSYKPASGGKAIPFFVDPDIRDNRVVLEGTCAT